jgi:alpha-mannosidase/mannosylglycerate hydrolase
MPDRPTIHYVLSTHWDREWYQPFQDYRHRLVKLLDRVIDGLRDGRLDGPFTCDGQAIILDDYLEIRPEYRELVRQLVKERKLIVGPWYVLPDEWLVSGEAMIRNIELGRRIAREYGAEPSDAGFVCDLFGHVSQLPQILAGFGATGALVWRGIDLPDQSCVFRWRSPDGSELIAYRFGKDGYCDFAVKARGLWSQQPPTVDSIRAWLTEELARSRVGVALAFDGADHIEWDPRVSEVLRQLKEGNEFVVKHTTLDTFIADLNAKRGEVPKVVTGELRQPGTLPFSQDHQWLIPGVLSSRVWIKQQNDECTSLLTQWAEPMALLASRAAGVEYPAGFLDVAWRTLLQNHPHDSICGCSIDEVHQDVEYRFRQVRQIAQRLRRDACGRVAASIEPKPTKDELRVTLYNSAVRDFSGVTTLTLHIPQDWPKFNEFFGFEPKPAFRIYDSAGVEVPYQRLAQDMGRSKFRFFSHKFPQHLRTDDVTVAIEVKVPALGYTSLVVKREPENAVPTRHPAGPLRHTSTGVRFVGEALVVGPVGGDRFERLPLVEFEDAADIGDGWYHGPPVNDEVVTSVAAPRQIAVLHDTPLLQTVRVTTTLNVPGEFDFSSMRRSKQRVPLVIETDYTMRRDTPFVDVVTRITNPAKDHRVRAILPAVAHADTYFADSAFDVVERPVALAADNHTYRELEVETRPQQSWTAVADAKCGLAVVATGLKETAALDQPGRPIALTLFRSTRRTVFTDGQPDGQMLGRELVFRWRIVPLLDGKLDRVRLCKMGQELAAGGSFGGLHVEQFTEADLGQFDPTPSPQPKTASLLRVDGQVVVTSLRQVHDGSIELRAFNPNDEPATLSIAPGVAKFSTAQAVNFDGRPTGAAVAVKDGAARVDVPAKKIVTLRLK